MFERWDEGAETYFVRRKTGEVVRVPARGVRFGKMVEAAKPSGRGAMSDRRDLPTAFIRRRLGSEDAHYGGNLVAGAKQLEIVGDLITELAMRYDGDEGLFRAYESVEFLAPLYAGDWIEAKGRIVRVGNDLAHVRVRGLEGRRAARRHQRVGGGVPRRAGPHVPGGGDDGRDEGPSAVRPRIRRGLAVGQEASLETLQHGQQVVHVERLGHERVGAHLRRLGAIAQVRHGRDHDHPGRSSRGSCIISSSTLQPSIVGIMMSSSMSWG